MPNQYFLTNPATFSLDGVISPKPGQSQTCYLTNATTDHGFWTDINPLNKKLPMFVIQLIIATSVTRLLLLVAKPLRQPPFLAEYLVSIICCIYSFPSILYLGSLMVVLVVVGEIFFMIWTNICMVNCIEYLYNVHWNFYIIRRGLGIWRKL